jgi:peptidoglycan/LPS O-acetylase OafA/YrhL
MGRGLAALAVAAFHLSIMFDDPRYRVGKVFGDYTWCGYLGVDFFFVLSGFIIMFVHHRDIGVPGKLKEYAAKRLVRVHPVYWIFTALIILGASATGGVNRPPSAPGDILSMLTLIRFTDYAMPLEPSWTLFHEILFYIFFGVLLINRWLGAAALALWFAVVGFHFQYPAYGNWSFRNDLLSLHNISFLCGIAAFWLSRRLSGRAGPAVMLGGVALVVLVLVLDEIRGRSDQLELGYSFAFLFVIAGAVTMERQGQLLSVPLLALIGDASYTLYLSHESVGSTFLKVMSRLGVLTQIDPRLIYFAIYLAMVVFAVAFYWTVERPMLRALRGLFAERRSQPRSAAVSEAPGGREADPA